MSTKVLAVLDNVTAYVRYLENYSAPSQLLQILEIKVQIQGIEIKVLRVNSKFTLYFNVSFV